jgi:hypothetical protein
LLLKSQPFIHKLKQLHEFPVSGAFAFVSAASPPFEALLRHATLPKFLGDATKSMDWSPANQIRR